MNPRVINGIIEETDAIIAGLEAIKNRLRTWTPTNDSDEVIGRTEVSKLLGISYKHVGILTKQGILKNYGTDRISIYLRSKCLQALQDNAIWKCRKPGTKKPRTS